MSERVDTCPLRRTAQTEGSHDALSLVWYEDSVVFSVRRAMTADASMPRDQALRAGGSDVTAHSSNNRWHATGAAEGRSIAWRLPLYNTVHNILTNPPRTRNQVRSRLLAGANGIRTLGPP
jgi:hypothetical protein